MFDTKDANLIFPLYGEVMSVHYLRVDMPVKIKFLTVYYHHTKVFFDIDLPVVYIGFGSRGNRN